MKIIVGRTWFRAQPSTTSTKREERGEGREKIFSLLSSSSLLSPLLPPAFAPRGAFKARQSKPLQIACILTDQSLEREIKQRHDTVMKLVRSLEVRAEFYEQKDAQNAAARAAADDDEKRNAERCNSSSEGPSCYVSILCAYVTICKLSEHITCSYLIWFPDGSHKQMHPPTVRNEGAASFETKWIHSIRTMSDYTQAFDSVKCYSDD